ncbi:M56 family metallopeptidase [Paenibacillus sp. J31TS4]|uniref:M56 family metallopeptidase n=1 Tax=Paenibacillus sp. J31TS4 TaxID=2807195 RepID=UPI001BD02BF8|nr:M56 family metallopeptidase [Paenibacillus sp. J31TS4]
MMGFFLSLLLASFVGTFLWMVQSCIRPLTQKMFSQTWHYYAGLIPVFFLLGGSELLSRLTSFYHSVFPDTGTISHSGSAAEHLVPIPSMAGTAISSSLSMREQFDFLLRLDNLKEFVLFATVIWAAGAAVFLVINIKKYWAFKRSLLQESQISDAGQYPVKIIVSAGATTPLVMGIWKPVVILPDTRFSDKELAMILSHELIHVKRGDLLVKLLVFLANAVHWFNPAAYSLNKQINTLCELSCDEKVVQGMDMENRRLYGETLLSMLEYGVMQRNVVCTSGLCNPKKYMKRRLIHLMNVKKTNKAVLMLSLAATISIVGIGGLVAYAADSAMPVKAVSPKAVLTNIPTGKEPAGHNVYIQSEDGTVLYYDKDGSVTEVPEMRKRLSPPENNAEDDLRLKRIESLSTAELVELTKKGIEQNAVPQVYVDALPQKELDAINKTYGWELQRSK